MSFMKASSCMLDVICLNYRMSKTRSFGVNAALGPVQILAHEEFAVEKRLSLFGLDKLNFKHAGSGGNHLWAPQIKSSVLDCFISRTLMHPTFYATLIFSFQTFLHIFFSVFLSLVKFDVRIGFEAGYSWFRLTEIRIKFSSWKFAYEPDLNENLDLNLQIPFEELKYLVQNSSFCYRLCYHIENRCLVWLARNFNGCVARNDNNNFWASLNSNILKYLISILL